MENIKATPGVNTPTKEELMMLYYCQKSGSGPVFKAATDYLFDKYESPDKQVSA